MKRFSDYIVKPRNEGQIKALAQSCRWRGGVDRELYFNIVKFLQNSFKGENSAKGKLLFAVVNNGHPRDLPYVEYRPLTLFVSRDILRKAETGDAFTRFQLAHEAGHIVMHDHYARSFSTEKIIRVKSLGDDHSAEWQANTFAKYFLLPDWVFYVARSPEEILSRVRVPRPLLDERIDDIVALNRDRGVIFRWGQDIGELGLVCQNRKS